MPCDRVRSQLTSYLDGELDSDRGTVVRGHLRVCEACSKIAEDEAALRDGLRALPSVDPPSTLWANVQARLAVEEVAESKRPAWRLALARWSRFVPSTPRLATGVVVGALAVGFVWWKTQPEPESGFVVELPKPPIPERKLVDNGKPEFASGREPQVQSQLDVTDDLLSEPARITASYQRTIDELIAVAGDMRTGWSDGRKTAFDTKVKTMRESIATADEGKPKQRASRAMIRYLEGALIRDDVLLASRGDR